MWRSCLEFRCTSTLDAHDFNKRDRGWRLLKPPVPRWLVTVISSRTHLTAIETQLSVKIQRFELKRIERESIANCEIRQRPHRQKVAALWWILPQHGARRPRGAFSRPQTVIANDVNFSHNEPVRWSVYLWNMQSTAPWVTDQDWM
jgi:hypothetical protein